MWKVVITEIQDANTIDPTSAPPGAFFVSTERFAQTVEYLDLHKVIGLINRIPYPHGKRSALSDRISCFEATGFAELEQTA
jgi:hypothetical protein